MPDRPRNIGVSARQRLLNLPHARGRSAQAWCAVHGARCFRVCGSARIGAQILYAILMRTPAILTPFRRSPSYALDIGEVVMETYLLQALSDCVTWWGTLPGDNIFLMLLPFAIGGLALVSEAFRNLKATGHRIRGMQTA